MSLSHQLKFQSLILSSLANSWTRTNLSRSYNKTFSPESLERKIKHSTRLKSEAETPAAAATLTGSVGWLGSVMECVREEEEDDDDILQYSISFEWWRRWRAREGYARNNRAGRVKPDIDDTTRKGRWWKVNKTSTCRNCTCKAFMGFFVRP